MSENRTVPLWTVYAIIAPLWGVLGMERLAEGRYFTGVLGCIACAVIYGAAWWYRRAVCGPVTIDNSVGHSITHCTFIQSKDGYVTFEEFERLCKKYGVEAKP